MQLRLDNFERQLKRAGVLADNGVRDIEKRFERANPGLSRTLQGAFAGISVGAAARGFREAIASLSDLADAAQRLGVSTDFIQQFGYAVQLTGGTAANATNGLELFAKALSDAATGTGNLSKVLVANNVAIQNTDGSIRSVEEMLGRYADLIRNAKSPQDALNLSVIAFGKDAGPAMVNALQNGAAGLSDIAREAKAAGIIIDSELVKKGAELDDIFTKLETSASAWVKSLAVSLASDLLPALPYLEKLVGYMQAINAFAENPFKLGQGLRQILEGQNPTKIGEIGLAGGMGTKLGDASDIYDALGFSKPLQVTISKPTVVPKLGRGGGGGRRGGGARVDDDRSKEVIADLELELQKVQAVGAAREEILTKERVLQELRHANVDALSEEGKKITALVEAIDEAAREQERIAQAMADFRSVAEAGLGSLVDGLIDGKDAAEALEDSLKNMLGTIAQIAQQKLLDGLFGSGAGGIGGILSGFLGGGGGSIVTGTANLYAGGTKGSKAGWAIVGEHGPELMKLRAGTQIAPTEALGMIGKGGGETTVNVINNNGSQIRTTERATAGGGKAIDVVVDEIVGNKLGTGGSSSNRAVRMLGGRMPLTRR